MNNISIIFGVCVDNADPNNAHRIRFFPISSLDTLNRSLTDIQNIVTNQDNQGNYTAWEYSTVSKNTDPFLAETFMPKYVNMVPEKGQLVKLFKYDLDVLRYEYIGPITSDPIKTKESFITALQKSRPNNNNVNGITPNTSILPISGKNNEQILLGNNQIVQRLDYITTNKTKKTTYPFVQFAEFPLTNDIKTVETTKVTQIDYRLDFALTVNFIYATPGTAIDGRNYICEIKVYNCDKVMNVNGLFGLSKSLVSFTDTFRRQLKTSDITIRIEAENVKKLLNEFANVLSAFKQKKIYKFPSTTTTEVYTYQDQDYYLFINNQHGFLPNDGGSLPDDPSVVLNDSVVVLKDINQIPYSQLNDSAILRTYNIDRTTNEDFNYFSNFVSQGQYENFITKLAATSKEETLTENVSELTKELDSYWVAHVNKILLYSTKNDIPLTNNTNATDAATQKKLAELFKISGEPNERFQNSHPLLRGDKLITVMIKMIDLLLKHGHEAGINPPESLDKTSDQLLNELKTELSNDLVNSINSIYLNHNIRIN